MLMSISVFVPVALLGLLSYDKSKKQLESVTSQFLQDNLRLNAKQLNTFFKSVEKEAEKMTASRELQILLGANPPQTYGEEVVFINRMIDIVSQLKGSYELYVFPKDMEHFPSYRKLIKLNKIEPRPEYFKQAFERQDNGLWFHVWDDDLHKPIFIYVRAIRSSYYYEPLGVLAIQIPDYLIRDELASPSSFKNYRFMMLDSGSRIISHPNPNKYGEAYVPSEGWSKAEIRLNEAGWKLIAAVPQKDLTGKIDQIQNFTFWIVVVSLIVITVFLMLIVQSFTLPIKMLVLHMNKVRTGVLRHFELERTRKDEVGQLVRGYNQMISGMSELLETTKEMESDKRRLEIQTLNHQINPHFFYNTLDAIKWRAENAGEHNIAAMVTKLANLLRFSLNNGNEWTTVEREIEHARNYLDIELLRSNRAFQVFFQIDPEIMKLQVIKLILQPLMENAVKHGVNNLPEGKGKIRLTAKRKEQDIMFIIEDNGPGLAEEQPLELDRLSTTTDNEFQHGIGLRNVHKRLQLHFGGDYGIRVDPGDSAGFRVIVRHPVFSHDPEH
jgi:two-component system sensor histidine kinase YesM